MTAGPILQFGIARASNSGKSVIHMISNTRPLESSHESCDDAQRPLRGRFSAVSVIAMVAMIFLLKYAQALLVPIVLSVLIAYALNPFVTLLERIKVPRTPAAVLVLTALFGVIGFGALALRQQAGSVLDSVPGSIAMLRGKLQTFRASRGQSASTIGKLQKAADEIQKTAVEATVPARGPSKVETQDPPIRITEYVWSGSLGLLAIIRDSVLVMFLVFFLLASGDLYKRKFVHLIGTTFPKKRMTVETLNEVNAQIERFLLIQLLSSAVVAVCTGMVFWLMGLNQPAFWGTAAGILTSVPYVGPIAVTIAISLVAFAQFDSLAPAAKILLFLTVIFSFEGLLVKPAIMGKAARINGVAMFVSLLFWSWVWGLIGVLVAVPIMMVIKSVCDRVEPLRPVGELLGEN
jgi:predicted PurR-regulated permease PerM